DRSQSVSSRHRSSMPSNPLTPPTPLDVGYSLPGSPLNQDRCAEEREVGGLPRGVCLRPRAPDRAFQGPENFPGAGRPRGPPNPLPVKERPPGGMSLHPAIDLLDQLFADAAAGKGAGVQQFNEG